jgi:hypothetical protein
MLFSFDGGVGWLVLGVPDGFISPVMIFSSDDVVSVLQRKHYIF